MAAMRMMTDEDRADVWCVPGLSGVELFKATFTAFEYGLHTHDTVALGLIERGTQRFRHGGRIHTAEAGSIIAVNPGEAHDGRAADAAGYSYRMMYLNVERLSQLDGRVRLPPLQGPVCKNDRLARKIGRLMLSLDRDRSDAFPTLLAVETALLAIWRALSANSDHEGTGGSSAPDARLCRARDFLAAHAVENVRLSDVACVANLSPFHFLRRFTTVYGLTPHAFMMAMRLETARQRLAAGATIADTAVATGFADQAHLTRRFKAAYGVTPGAFRTSRSAISFKTGHPFAK